MGHNQLHNGMGREPSSSHWTNFRTNNINGHNLHDTRPKMEIKGLIIVLKFLGHITGIYITGYTLLNISFATWQAWVLLGISSGYAMVIIGIGFIKLLKAWDDYTVSRLENKRKKQRLRY